MQEHFRGVFIYLFIYFHPPSPDGVKEKEEEKSHKSGERK